MPPTAPSQYSPTDPWGNTGSGPISYRNAPSDPFAAMDNYIQYQNMVRSQEVTQYQQNVMQPPDLTQRQMFRILTQDRYGRGVDAVARETMFRTFQRRNETQREVFSA